MPGYRSPCHLLKRVGSALDGKCWHKSQLTVNHNFERAISVPYFRVARSFLRVLVTRRIRMICSIQSVMYGHGPRRLLLDSDLIRFDHWCCGKDRGEFGKLRL